MSKDEKHADAATVTDVLAMDSGQMIFIQRIVEGQMCSPTRPLFYPIRVSARRDYRNECLLMLTLY